MQRQWLKARCDSTISLLLIESTYISTFIEIVEYRCFSDNVTYPSHEPSSYDRQALPKLVGNPTGVWEASPASKMSDELDNMAVEHFRQKSNNSNNGSEKLQKGSILFN